MERWERERARRPSRAGASRADLSARSRRLEAARRRAGDGFCGRRRGAVEAPTLPRPYSTTAIRIRTNPGCARAATPRPARDDRTRRPPTNHAAAITESAQHSLRREWDGLCCKVNSPHHLPPSHRQTFGSRSEARRARAARRGGAEAGALHPARGRHRLAPQLTALRPLRRRTTGVAQKATPGVGCSLDPSPAAPSPGRLTAHGACSPPPPRVPRRHACPLP